MEVLPMSSPHFNTDHKNLSMLQETPMIADSVSGSNELSSNHYSSDQYAFHCIVCSDVYIDSNALREHMQRKHPDLYADAKNDPTTADEEYPSIDEGCDDDDDSFDYSSIMEPICELSHAEDEINATGNTSDFTSSVAAAPTRDQQQMQAQCLQQQLQQLQLLHQIQMQQQQLVDLQKKHLETNSSATPFDQLMVLPEIGRTQHSLSSNEEDEEDDIEDADSRSTTSTSSTGGQNITHRAPQMRGRRRDDLSRSLPTNTTYKPDNGPSLFQCSQCEESFAFSGDLARHVRSHTQNKPFQCSICDKTFTHIGSLNTHIRIHSGEKPYKCKICSKAFTQSSSLMVHLKSHSVKKPYQCEICDKGFVNSSSLVIHMKAHAERDPFPCDECDKTFKQAQLLAEHRAVHLNLPMYQCSICRERFRQACELVQHMKGHTGAKPFQCSICEKSFTQPGSLSTHMRIHTGERPFECKLCSKSFSQASSLSMHKKTHTAPGSKNVQCKICHKRYTHQTYLTKHMACHEAYACPICSQKFQEPIAMFQHISRDHALGKQRKLKCWECGQQYTNDKQFMEHLRQHADTAEQKLLQRAHK